MFYGYVKLEDETQFTYSELRDDHTVLVCVERPVDMGFDSAECLLPAFRWNNVKGFSEADLAWLDAFVRNNAPLIMRFAREKSRVAYA